ncbi:Glycerate 2-kinase [compost metagenome]
MSMNHPEPAPRRPHVLVAPDSFKGSLSAIEAAQCMARGVARALPDCIITQLPMADGGEGSAEVVASALAGEWAWLEATDANGDGCRVPYAFCRDSSIGRFVILDSAAIVGLPQARLAPELRTTRGLGEALRELYERGERTLVVGLGGTSTMDGGAGLLAELALDFRDAQGVSVAPVFANLAQITRLERRSDSDWLEGLRLIALTDVDSPLCGPLGSSFVFGEQKGFTDLQQADRVLARFAGQCEAAMSNSFSARSGAGAAGGLGFALGLIGAELQSGAAFIAATLALESSLGDYDWVITGEGCSDRQTLFGKGPGHIAALAREQGVPVSLLSGAIEDSTALAQCFDGCFSIMPRPASLEYAIEHAGSLLEEASAQLAGLFAAIYRQALGDRRQA